jgi:hypothetical protein
VQEKRASWYELWLAFFLIAAEMAESMNYPIVACQGGINPIWLHLLFVLILLRARCRMFAAI